MNNKNSQEVKPRFKITQYLFGLALMGNHMAGFQANQLLINGGRAPIPARFKNQKQKRKLAAQTR